MIAPSNAKTAIITAFAELGPVLAIGFPFLQG
jgi:hypothetical protein